MMTSAPNWIPRTSRGTTESRLFPSVMQFCIEQGQDKVYWLGLSGGLDSVVLLHLLVQVRSVYPIQLHAVHVHHGLSTHAASWVSHCQALCESWQVPFSSFEIDAKAKVGESQEEVARQHRYAIFQRCLLVGDIFLTAHHQDDQAETVLLQLLRGAGPKGLAAMPHFIPFHQGFLARPLLSFSREQLSAYSTQCGLKWVEDESNANENYARNFIRHTIFPSLKTRWPSVTSTISRVADHCAETQTLLDTYLKKDLEDCMGSQSGTLSVEKIKKYDHAHVRALLRCWLQQYSMPLPSAIKMKHILSDVLSARVDKQPCVTWGQCELRRYRDDLYVMQQNENKVVTAGYEWDFQSPLQIGNKRLTACLMNGKGLCAELVKKVTVRFRDGGGRCHLPGRTHHHSLKKILQEQGVPPWLREQVPLLFLGEELIAIVGYFIAEQYVAKEGQEGWMIEWIV